MLPDIFAMILAFCAIISYRVSAIPIHHHHYDDSFQDSLSTFGPFRTPSVVTVTVTPSEPDPTLSTTMLSPSSSTGYYEPISTPTDIPIPQDDRQRYVVAHHMAGNTYPYTIDDWAEDILLASANGIDGFALNVGPEEWQVDRVADAFEAARTLDTDFKLFLSLDMATFPCDSPESASTIRDFVLRHIDHPNQLRYDDRALVSTFAGESCTFGESSVPEGWRTHFTKHPDLDGRIYFVPAFFIAPCTFEQYEDVMDGDFNASQSVVAFHFIDQVFLVELWLAYSSDHILRERAPREHGQSHAGYTPKQDNKFPAGARLFSALGDALTEAEAAPLNALQAMVTKFVGSTDTDREHLEGLAALHHVDHERSRARRRDDASGLGRKLYMAAVSPWFFTHYGQESFNKNFVFLSDQHLYVRRWESLIAHRDQFDVIQVLTWNDYGESHYIGPIKGAQPNSEAWVNGMNHTGWLELTEYYARAFKTGQYPAIERDRLFMWARTHPTHAQAPDPVGQPDNYELMEDAVWAIAMTTEPSIVVLSTSPSDFRTFTVPAGVSKLSIPISAGGIMRGVIERYGQSVVELNPQGFTFRDNPEIYNFNAFVASASAP
ncbi:hypothetical protein AX16_008002 [Volvariella volvacea WC 439]|nr:hypothetical protein AX16_008002 [Volvariella volvacea WC 439]